MHENGLKEISNINQHLISSTSTDPGASLVSSMEGSRPILLEMQALCVSSKFGMPQRVVTGVDPEVIVDAVKLQTSQDMLDAEINVPDDYKIENTSHRVIKLIIGTAKLSNMWNGIKYNDLT